MSALDRLTRHQHEGLVLDAEETREVLEHIAGLEKERDELLAVSRAAMRFIDSHVADPDITRDMADAYSDLMALNPDAVITNATGA